MKYSPAYECTGQRRTRQQLWTGKLHLVATPDERPASDVEEAHVLRDLLPLVELCRLDIPINLHMPLRRSHVLPEGHNVDIDLAELYKKDITSTLRILRAVRWLTGVN